MENVLHLCGDIKAAPTISHESHGIVFYTFPLSVERLSGAWDTLNVIAPEAMCRRCAEGARMRLFGQVRSYNNHGAEGSRLQISAWAKSLEESADACDNRVLLHGVLCKLTVAQLHIAHAQQRGLIRFHQTADSVRRIFLSHFGAPPFTCIDDAAW